MDIRDTLERSIGSTTLSVGYPNGVQVGGLGTGRIEVARDGSLGLSVITNNWAHPFTRLPGNFMALSCQLGDEGPRLHLLQRPGLGACPGVSAVYYQGWHPIAEVEYLIAGLPLRVSLTAFSPLIPHDLDRSAIPGAVLLFRLTNQAAVTATCAVSVSWENTLGCGGDAEHLVMDRTGAHQRAMTTDALHGVHFTTTAQPTRTLRNTLGAYLLAVAPGAYTVESIPLWNALGDGERLLRFLRDGAPCAAYPACPDGREGAVHPAGLVRVSRTLAPGEGVTIPVVLAWHTPGHYATQDPSRDYGHYYQRRYPDVVAVAEDLLAHYPEYLDGTRAVHRFLAASDLPEWLTAKLVNDLTALTTNSVVTRDGTLSTLEASRGMGGALGTIDQRLVAHAGYALFYPDLNRTELALFAAAQAEDGHIPHFTGNVHQVIGDAGVPYGDTTWPDLSCSFIIQCFRDLIATGETAFFARMWPHITRAFAWLRAADRDGDGVPEGGSSWDIEEYAGLFVYTGMLWLVTLRVMERLAAYQGDATLAEAVACDYARASGAVARLWNGSYFNKTLDPRTGAACDDLFIGQLAGEWLARLLGLESIIPREQLTTALATLYRTHGDTTRYRLMPIQLRRDGTLLPRPNMEQSWPQYAMCFLDGPALQAGMVEPAMRSLRQFDTVIREMNRTPWGTTLWYDARTGLPMGDHLDWYMNTPAVWLILDALTGFHPNEIEGWLAFGPRHVDARGVSHYPLCTPRYWATLRYDTTGAAHAITFSPTRFFRGDEIRVQSIKLRGHVADAHCRLHDQARPCALGHTPGYSVLTFAGPVTLTAGSALTITYRPEEA